MNNIIIMPTLNTSESNTHSSLNKIDNKTPWIESDPDSVQRCRRLSTSLFELIQINSVSNSDVCLVSHTTVDINDYSNNELIEYLHLYGYDYDDVAEFKNNYKEAYQLIAEMIFETISYEYFVTSPLLFGECKEYIDQITSTI